MTVHRPRRLRLLVAALAGVLLLTGFSLAAAAPGAAHLAKGAEAHPEPERSSSSTGPSPTPAGGTPSPAGCWATATPSSPSPTRCGVRRRMPEYLRQFLSTIEGPIVLVGHSYGGAVITNAATGDPDVKALVYIAAYALAEGESVAAANALGGGHTDVTDHLVVRPFPGASDGNADVYIDPAYFPNLFAQDLPKATARVMAATQRPGAFAALLAPSGAPAWETIPSWYLVARQDRIIPPEAERAMAARARASHGGDRQLPRRDDEPPVSGGLTHQGSGPHGDDTGVGAVAAGCRGRTVPGRGAGSPGLPRVRRPQ